MTRRRKQPRAWTHATRLHPARLARRRIVRLKGPVVLSCPRSRGPAYGPIRPADPFHRRQHGRSATSGPRRRYPHMTWRHDMSELEREHLRSSGNEGRAVPLRVRRSSHASPRQQKRERYVTRMMYLRRHDDNVIYVFATRARPHDPMVYTSSPRRGQRRTGHRVYRVTVRDVSATSATASTPNMPAVPRLRGIRAAGRGHPHIPCSSSRAASHILYSCSAQLCTVSPWTLVSPNCGPSSRRGWTGQGRRRSRRTEAACP